jgi:hypothetical protein
MFALLEAESAFKKRQKRKDLDDRWNYWKKVIIQADKTVPGPAKDAFRNIIRRRDKIYFAAKDSSDPALGGSSGFDPGTTSTGTFTGSGDDVEQDAIDTQQNTIKFQGKRVPKLNKDNWKQWIVRAQRLLSKYAYTYGSRKKTESINEELRYFVQLVEKSKDNIDWSKIEPMSGDDERDWKQIRNMFSAMGATLPDEATNAWKDLEFQKSKGDVDVKTKQRAYGDTDDPALGGSSGFDPGTTSTGDFTGSGDDVEADAMLANLPKQSGMGMQSQIDPSNRVAKDQKNRDGYTERIQRIMYSLNMGDLKNSVRKAKTDLRNITAQLPNAEAAKYSTIFYSLLATKLGLQGFVRSDRIVFADGSTEKVDANNEEHKKIVRAQYDLGLIDNIKANKLVDLFGLNDLPSQSGMSQQMQAGTKGFKNTGELKLKGTSKTLPPLTSATVNDYVTAYLGILRKYKSGTGKGGGNIAVSKVESKSNSIRQYLNILHELESKNNDPNALKQPETAELYNQQRSKISSNDRKDLEAIENAFKTAQQRKAIKPAEHTKFTEITKYKEQLFKKLDAVSTRTKGETPDAVKDASTTTAPYGIFNDQVMAVIGNPTPENLIKQAEAAAAMDLDGWDTEKTKLKAVYGHVAKALRLPGIITHKNSFWDGPMVVYPQGSGKTSELFPFGEYEWEDLDWENPKHKKIGQSQADKNLLPSSIEDTYKRVDDVFDRLDIKEPTDAEKDNDSAISQRERYKEKIRKDLEAKQREEEWGRLMAPAPEKTTATDKDTDQTATSPTQPQKTTPELPKINSSTSQYKYSRFVPISDITNINSLLALPKSVKLFVDRVPRGDKLNIVSDAAVKQFSSNGKYKIARQTSPEESPDAYNAITAYLDKNGLAFTDEETAQRWKDQKKFGKDLEYRKDDKFPDRVGGPGDNAYQMGTAGKDKDLALARINDKPEEPPAPEAQPAEEPAAAGTDQDLRPSFSQSRPTGNVFSIAQDSQGWYVVKIGPKGKQYRMSQHYKDKTEAENSAKAKASSTNSKYEPYDDNQTVDAPFGGSSSEQDDLKLISQWNTQADNLLNILNNPNSSDSDKKSASSKWMNGENINFLNELLDALTDPAQRQNMSDELQDAITKMHQKEKSINDIYKKLTGQQVTLPAGIDNKEIERIRNLAGVPSPTEPETQNTTKPETQNTTKPETQNTTDPKKEVPVQAGVSSDSSSPALTTQPALSPKTSWSVIQKNGKFYISNGKIEKGPFTTNADAGTAANAENAEVAANLFKKDNTEFNKESTKPGEMIYDPEQAKYVPATGKENAQAYGAPSAAKPNSVFQPMKDAFYKVISSPDPDTQEPRWMVINVKETNPSLKNSGPVFLDKSQADNAAAQANAKINDSTNFTRLLKNAGLLKEFY